MRGIIVKIIILLLFFNAKSHFCETIALYSPNKEVCINFFLDEQAQPNYSVSFWGKIVISNSKLGINFKQHGLLCKNMEILKTKKVSIDETYNVIVGKSSSARNHCNELTIFLQEKYKPERKLNIIFRVYDEGAAFRYQFPEQDANNEFIIVDEITEFQFPLNYKYWGAPNSNNGEVYYRPMHTVNTRYKVDIAVPITIERPDDIYMAITEANLTDYAGMDLRRIKDKLAFKTDLTPFISDSTIKVKAGTPHVSPWRVIMLGKSPGDLIESNIILNLNEPCKIEDTSWIRGYKMLAPWINGYINRKEDILDPSELTFEHQRENTILNIDFAAENNFNLIEMVGWAGTESESIHHFEKLDMTKPVENLDMPYLIEYGKNKGVYLVLWAFWKNIYDQMDKCFPVWEKWGIVSINPDYMNRDNQEMVNIYHKIAKKAAEHHLLVYFHGAYKPTGIRRTWPNIITREAVLGGEYNKWEPQWDNNEYPNPEYNVTIPYVRMLAGPMDYTPASFTNVTPENFRGRWKNPMTLGTRCHQLAMLVVYESPQTMLFDWHGAYRNQIGFEFIKVVGTTWDETRFIDGKIGEFIVIARRKGNDWFVGGMTDWHSREIKIPLEFLGKGAYKTTIYADGPLADKKPTEVCISHINLSAKDNLSLRMTAGGGYAIHFTPVLKE